MADEGLAETARCSKCNQLKPISAFRAKKSSPLGRYTRCRVCYAEDNRAACRRWYRNNAKAVADQKRRVLMLRYGISLEDYDRLLEAQGGVCAICCGKSKGGRSLAVDHCHDTGKVRGLLCNYCNLGIGQLGDTVEALERAAAYLRAAK